MIKSCMRCILHTFARNRVQGTSVIVNSTRAIDILFIGEAPGKSENLVGVPFVGPSGKLLKAAIRQAGLDVFFNYSITNVVQCRPTDTLGGPSREPLPAEIAACAENFDKVVQLANPKVVVFLGAVAARAYRNRFPSAYALPHPSYILRKGGESSPAYRAFVASLEEIRNALQSE
jgi:uracil-DNA glycosylase family 4